MINLAIQGRNLVSTDYRLAKHKTTGFALFALLKQAACESWTRINSCMHVQAKSTTSSQIPYGLLSECDNNNSLRLDIVYF